MSQGRVSHVLFPLLLEDSPMQDHQTKHDFDELLRAFDQQHRQAHITDDMPTFEAKHEYNQERHQWDVEIYMYLQSQNRRSQQIPLKAFHLLTTSQYHKTEGGFSVFANGRKNRSTLLCLSE